MDRKKTIWKILLLLFVIQIVYVIRPVRTMKTMETIAREKLMEEPFYLFTNKYENLYRDIEGPIITDRQNRVEFTWYKVLEWGDTASISALVYKNFLNEFSGAFRAKNEPD